MSQDFAPEPSSTFNNQAPTELEPSENISPESWSLLKALRVKLWVFQYSTEDPELRLPPFIKNILQS